MFNKGKECLFFPTSLYINIYYHSKAFQDCQKRAQKGKRKRDSTKAQTTKGAQWDSRAAEKSPAKTASIDRRQGTHGQYKPNSIVGNYSQNTDYPNSNKSQQAAWLTHSL